MTSLQQQYSEPLAPSKPLQGFSIHVPSSVVRLGKSSCNGNHTAQVVTGLDLVPLTDGIDVNLQHPDYTDERTRLQSFKHWCGVIPATELADAGLYMVARDTVRCYILLSCSYTRLEERRSAH